MEMSLQDVSRKDMRDCSTVLLFFANKKFANANLISTVSNKVLDFFEKRWYDCIIIIAYFRV